MLNYLQISSKFNQLFLKCRNELTNSTHKISLAGLEILDEITALIRECELGLIDKSSSLLKKKLFKDEDSINFGEERLYPNDCIFGYLLQEHISGYLLCLVTEPFVELFYTNTSSVNPCFTLFNALCFKGEIKSFITKDEWQPFIVISDQQTVVGTSGFRDCGKAVMQSLQNAALRYGWHYGM